MRSPFALPLLVRCGTWCLGPLLGLGSVLAGGAIPATAAEDTPAARQDDAPQTEAAAPQTEAAAPQVDFARDVLPIFSDRCFQCHGPDAKEGRKADLRLDVEEDAKRDRGGYQVVAEGDLDASELWLRVEAGDMPPPDLGRPLSEEQITTLRRWIEQGAVWGKHWSFEPIRRPAVPPGSDHPIDGFVDRRLAAANVRPTPQASRRTLIRRLSLDLTGLPPTPAEVERFIEDDAPDAWLRLVDRTLQSPAYGERMAWNWLAAARYADSNGYQGDRERTMWPWRDWVVRAFNQNLPYDQFTVWQLAGDLLPHPSEDQIIATGFNRNHMINGEGGRIPEENRVDYVLDMTETAGTVWMGLTLNCCRCHDHKFDPLSQQEYYQLTAFFNQTPVDGSGGNPQTPPVQAVPSSQQEAARARLQQQIARLQEAVADAKAVPEPAAEPAESEGDASPPPPQAEALQAAREQLTALQARIPKVMVMADRKERRPTFILDRGLYNQHGEEVTAAVPDALPDLPTSSDADRLDLARWLVSPEHPLTARVTVNRYWQMLFGVGLVKTAEDFGAQSEYPTHPELLDWLAKEFIESGWDVKHVLRTILTSDTYQRQSAAPADAYRQDPENRLLARGPRFRMPSWMLRDQALAASGLLVRRIGGTPVKPYQPEGIWAEATFGKKVYQPDEGAALYRRSLYTFWRRIIGPPVFFDSAKRQVCEVKPLRTNTPMHALTTMNDVTYVEAARALASRVMEAASADAERFDRLGLRVLGRLPNEAERTIWERTLERSRRTFSATPDDAEALLQIGDSEPSPLPPVETAAWTALCLNLLNLDETVTKE